MIEETALTNEAIKKVILKKYGIVITEINKLNRGSANLYSLNGGQYILKEFQSKYTREEIEKEIRIINHLKKDNIPVPEYILTIDNQYSFIYKNKVITLQKYIKGYTIESNTATYKQMIESATYLGKIVKSLETFDGKLQISKDTIINDLNDKIFMIEKIKSNSNLNELEKLSIKNTHGDYSVLQFIYEDDKIKSIIDFVSACKMPIVWEIIRSYSYIDKEAKNNKISLTHLIDYVKGFQNMLN